MFSKYNMNIDTKSTFRFIESVAEVFVYSIIYMLVYKYLFVNLCNCNDSSHLGHETTWFYW